MLGITCLINVGFLSTLFIFQSAEIKCYLFAGVSAVFLIEIFLLWQNLNGMISGYKTLAESDLDYYKYLKKIDKICFIYAVITIVKVECVILIFFF